MKTNELVPLTQAATEIGCSYVTLSLWIRNGKVEGVYTGAQRKRARFVTSHEVERAKRMFRNGVRHA